MRRIDASEFKAPEAPPQVGAAPMLQWVKVGDLVVDDRYQRPIYGAGRINVRRIAAEFRWSKFAPLVVAPVEGGLYAVIDGQHRATSAALIGIETVPCQVIIADLAEQALAFKSINGQVTRMHKLAIQAAALAAGDAEAVELDEVARCAGVRLLRYPVTADRMAPRDTMALTAIAEGVRNYGRDVAISALQCVTETSNNEPGVLSGPVVRALMAVLGGNARWAEGGGALLEAFDAIGLEEELEEAKLTRRPKGTPVWSILADRLRERLKAADVTWPAPAEA